MSDRVQHLNVGVFNHGRLTACLLCDLAGATVQLPAAATVKWTATAVTKHYGSGDSVRIMRCWTCCCVHSFVVVALNLVLAAAVSPIGHTRHCAVTAAAAADKESRRSPPLAGGVPLCLSTSVMSQPAASYSS